MVGCSYMDLPWLYAGEVSHEVVFQYVDLPLDFEPRNRLPSFRGWLYTEVSHMGCWWQFVLTMDWWQSQGRPESGAPRLHLRQAAIHQTIVTLYLVSTITIHNWQFPKLRLPTYLTSMVKKPWIGCYPQDFNICCWFLQGRSCLKRDVVWRCTGFWPTANC